MKKWFYSGLVGLGISLAAVNTSNAQVLSVNGSTNPGVIFLGITTFDQPLLGPVTLFFGAGAVPPHPTPTILAQSFVGLPLNDRGFEWPRENMTIFGASTGFFTTGTGGVLFTSPSPAIDVVGIYNITPAAGAFVGSVGYGFPGVSGDQAFGIYTKTITLVAQPLQQSVNVTFRWQVVARFRLILTDVSAGRGDFGSVAFGESPPNQEFVLGTQTNYGEPYIITLSTPGIINQFGTELQGIKVFSDGLSGNNLRGVEIPISVATPVVSNQEIIIYKSNPRGNSDFFNLGLAIEPPFGQQAGDYSGTIVLTMTTK